MATMYQQRNRSPSFIQFAQKNENFDEAQIAFQPYRTTPLVLPGAKVPKKDVLPTESYLRHHPNPAMRAAPLHDYTDTLLKQKLVHKQFNSPIGLYSDSNIENTVMQSAQQQQQHLQAVPYKKTVVFDPSKSETYRALQEGAGEGGLQEVATPIQPRAFHGNRMVPGKKPIANHPAPQPEFALQVNSMGESNEKIHQSGSFRRLMMHVLSETDY